MKAARNSYNIRRAIPIILSPESKPPPNSKYSPLWYIIVCWGVGRFNVRGRGLQAIIDGSTTSEAQDFPKPWTILDIGLKTTL